MHAIVVYDINEARVSKVCNYLRRYLPRIQNSVFEGEITLAQLEKMKAGLSKIIVPSEDAIILWVLRDPKWADRQILGHERLPITNIL